MPSHQYHFIAVRYYCRQNVSRNRGSNSGSFDYKSNALPLRHRGMVYDALLNEGRH
jgi:hypothetical protein